MHVIHSIYEHIHYAHHNRNTIITLVQIVKHEIGGMMLMFIKTMKLRVEGMSNGSHDTGHHKYPLKIKY